MPKILWVLLPLLLYALYLVVQLVRQRAPARFALNVHTSLLLMLYLLGTSGLGIFWVANQQLPVFDWHYLFGYCTLLLVCIHLFFNLPMVWHWLRRKTARPAKTASAAPQTKGGTVENAAAKANGVSMPKGASVVKGALFALAIGVAFLLGTWQSGQRPNPAWPAQEHHRAQHHATASNADAVVAYHEFSSESQSSIFRRTPGIDWGNAPAEFKPYPDAVRIPLPKTGLPNAGLPNAGLPNAGLPNAGLPNAGLPNSSFSAAFQTGTPRQRPLQLAELGQILHLGAGITARRGGHNYRAAPSSGALFPSELYVLVREVDGLKAGIYHYDPEFHQLQLIDASLTRASDIGAPEAESADLVLVLGSLFRRTGYKYRDRAYRYAAADGGHLLENLRLAGNIAGLHGRLLPRFDDAQVAKALRLDPDEEGVLAVLAWQRHASPATLQSYRSAPVATSHPLGVTGLMQQASALQWQTAPQPSGEIALPAPAPASTSLVQTINERRSQRRYGGQAVPLPALSALLADVAQPAQLSAALSVHLVVNRVEGLAPGVYRYLAKHTLQQVRAGEFAAQARNAALEQDVIGDAAVVLIITASRPAILQDGARGYRHALLETGLLGERWLLGAVARGLAACPVGAFYDDESAALLGLDPRQHWVLHYAALGLKAGSLPN